MYYLFNSARLEALPFTTTNDEFIARVETDIKEACLSVRIMDMSLANTDMMAKSSEKTKGKNYDSRAKTASLNP